MPQSALKTVLQYIRGVVRPRDDAALTDRQLLDRFLQDREQMVFTALVQRHAAMVLTVARRVLGNDHDAEDAFQAVFFVLARKAGSIRRATLAGWLHQVTFRLALRAKADRQCRLAHERQAPAMLQTATDDHVSRKEATAVLDQELSRLPDKYRAPLVLHYFVFV